MRYQNRDKFHEIITFLTNNVMQLVCYQKAPGTNVRLVMGDSCGIGFSDDFEHLRSIASTARITNQKALSMVRYQRRKSKQDQTKPAVLDANKVKNSDEVIIRSVAKRIEVDSDQDTLGYIPRPVPGLGKGFSGSKVVVMRYVDHYYFLPEQILSIHVGASFFGSSVDA